MRRGCLGSGDGALRGTVAAFRSGATGRADDLALELLRQARDDGDGPGGPQLVSSSASRSMSRPSGQAPPSPPSERRITPTGLKPALDARGARRAVSADCVV